MSKRKKNMASDEPVMFQKRSQNAQPQNEILCSKGAWGYPNKQRLEAGWLSKGIACHSSRSQDKDFR